MLRIYKLLSFILLFPFSTIFLHAQSDPTIAQADQMPYFKGCEKMTDGSIEKRNCSNQAIVAFIANNLEMPKNTEATGVVYVSFFIDESGKAINAKILRGLEKSQDDAALKVVAMMPNFEPAQLQNKPVKVKMTVPIRFKQKEETEFSNGFQITWGNLKGKNIEKNELLKTVSTPITVRDETGNLLEINELMFERERDGKFSDAQSNGIVTDDMQKLVKKLKSGDSFTVTVTVQKKGQFFYVDRNFKIEQ